MAVGLRLVSVEVWPPITRLAAQRPFHRKISQQTIHGSGTRSRTRALYRLWVFVTAMPVARERRISRLRAEGLNDLGVVISLAAPSPAVVVQAGKSFSQ